MEEQQIRTPSAPPYISRFGRLLGGTLAVILCWGVMATQLTGCRFGNYTSAPQQPDPVTGFYGANPQSLQFCATGTATQCAQASPSQIPSFISAEITNPVALIVQDASTGDAVLTNYAGTGQTALPITVGSDDVTLSYTTSSSPVTLWNNPNCTTTTYLEENGTIVPGPGQPVPGSTSNTAGSLTLSVQVTQTFDGPNGSCAPELQAMSNCYQDVTQCGGADSGTNQQLQATVQGIFSTYIQAGVMAASDIPNMANVAYEVHYQ